MEEQFSKKENARKNMYVPTQFLVDYFDELFISTRNFSLAFLTGILTETIKIMQALGLGPHLHRILQNNIQNRNTHSKAKNFRKKAKQNIVFFFFSGCIILNIVSRSD